MLNNQVSKIEIRIDKDQIEKRFFKDAELLEVVLGHFVQTSLQAIADMRVQALGQEALAFSNTVHKLRGATLNFIQGPLAERLSEMESEARNQKRVLATEEDIRQIEAELKDLTQQLKLLLDSWQPNK